MISSFQFIKTPQTEFEGGFRKELLAGLSSHNKRHTILPSPKQISSSDPGSHKHPPLVYAWLPDADDLPERLDEKYQRDVANGIISEGKRCNQTEMANKIAEAYLEDNKTSDATTSSIDFLKMIYQPPTFLLDAVNKALRQEDLSRSRTLGPLAYILNQYINHHSSTNQASLNNIHTVYKQTTLSKEELSKYKSIADSSCPIFYWNGFISATQNSFSERFFGNILFVIRLPEKDCGVLDCSYLGFNYNEVLFPSGSMFKITKIKKDYTIYLEKITMKNTPPPKQILSSNLTPKVTSAGEKRLVKEWTDIKNELNNNNSFTFYDIFVIPSRESFYEWKALIPGPQDSCYDGAIFEAKIKVPSNYPFEAPSIDFVSKVWHPNVSCKIGNVCMDRLNEHWTPQLRVIAVVVSVQSLLSEFNTTNPLELLAAEQVKHNFKEFKNTVEAYSKNEKAIGEKVKDLMQKGASPQKAKLALMIADFNEDVAEQLCQKDVDEIVEIWWQSVKGWKI